MSGKLASVIVSTRKIEAKKKRNKEAKLRRKLRKKALQEEKRITKSHENIKEPAKVVKKLKRSSLRQQKKATIKFNRGIELSRQATLAESIAKGDEELGQIATAIRTKARSLIAESNSRFRKATASLDKGQLLLKQPVADRNHTDTFNKVIIQKHCFLKR